MSKLLTKILIYKVIVIDKKDINDFKNLVIFSSFNVETDVGVFVFHFKEDRRKRKRRVIDKYITYYVVGVDVPSTLKKFTKDETITTKSVLILKVILWNVKPATLVRLLSDVYMDAIIESIKAKDS